MLATDVWTLVCKKCFWQIREITPKNYIIQEEITPKIFNTREITLKIYFFSCTLNPAVLWLGPGLWFWGAKAVRIAMQSVKYDVLLES